MSNSDNIGALKARFEKKQPDSKIGGGGGGGGGAGVGGGRGGREGSSSPRVGRSSGGGGGASPKQVNKKQVKKLNTALAQSKPPEGPLNHQKAVAPIQGKSSGKHVKDGWVNKVGEEGEAGSNKEKTAASSALANVLKGSPSPKEARRMENEHGEVAKRQNGSGSSKSRTKSMEVKQLSSVAGKVGRGFHNSTSDSEDCSYEECSLECKLSSSWSDNDVSCTLKQEDTAEVCRLPVATRAAGKGAHLVFKDRGGVVHSNWNRNEKTVSLTSNALVSPSLDKRKPLRPPPAQKPHLLSLEHSTSKSRSTSDLTDIGIHVSNHKKPLPPPPKSLSHDQKSLLISNVSGDPKKVKAKPSPSGAKPSLGGAKPSPPGGAKPSLGGAKPSPGGAKPSPGRAKPSPGGAKPNKSPPSKKPQLGTKPALPGGVKPALPPAKPNVTGGVGKKRQPPPPPPISSKLTTKEKVESPQDDKGSSNKDVSNKELDATLTKSESHDLNSLSHDLEDTLINNSTESSDWVVVKESAISNSSKALPKPTSDSASPSPEIERKLSPISSPQLPSNAKKKQLPPIPSHSKRDSHDPIPLESSGTGSDSDTKSSNSKVNSLRSKFSTPPSPLSPSPSPFSPPPGVGVEEPPKSQGVVGKAVGVAPLSPPSPQIRVSPGSYSGPKLGGGANNRQGSPQEGQRMSSNRSNVDSGFISEAPDDLNLVRGVSIESLPGSSVSDDRGGVVSPLPLSPDVIEVEEGEAEPEPEPEVWDEAKIEKARNKRLNIATELLKTEITYSSRIKVVAVDFYEVVKQYNLKSKQCIPEAATQQIFLNIIQIHQLSENILLELQARMDKWSTHEALGDVIIRLAPFLKLYATFTAGFEDAIKTLTECTKKDRKFDAVVRDFERTSISTGLGLASYMLEPVQRIPRYRLLLRDYLKYLPPDSSDRADTESALRIISEAADHSNDMIKELENSNEILSIQRSLVDYEGTLLAPSRSFIMGGPLRKSSRKTFTQRYFFLFSDILLHTYPPENNIYKFRNEMPVYGMNVEDPKASLTPFSINIYSTTRSLILVASSEQEKRRWIAALQSVILQDMKKRSSLRRDVHLQVHRANNLFGTKAPIMVPDKSVTMCQGCCAEFTFTFRRHHCRACGKVVCGGCSQQKCYLPYISKMERVCESCYVESKTPDRNSGDECTDSPLPSPVGPRKIEPAAVSSSGVLHLKAYEEDAVIAGYVLAQEGRKWNKMWYQIKRDCVLYKFKAHEDIKAIHSMPLPGYAVGSDKKQYTITLNHHSGMKNLCDTFKVDDETAFENWQEAIRKVIRMEFDTIGTQPVVSPLARHSRSFNDSSEAQPSSTPSSRPVSQHSSEVSGSSRTDSFSTVSTESRPPSERELSPSAGDGGGRNEILESSESLSFSSI